MYRFVLNLFYGTLLFILPSAVRFTGLLSPQLQNALWRRLVALRQRDYARFWAPFFRTTVDAKRQRLLGRRKIAKTSIAYPSPEAPVIATVVIASYNYGAYLEATIRSVLNQTVQDIEIVIVDDASPDPFTQSELDRLATLPRVTIVKSSINRGLPATRNAGIELARGEYVCCLDSDDLYEPTYLEQAIAALETDRSLGFVYAWAGLFGDVEGVWQTQDFSIDRAATENVVAASAVFRRDDWALIGGFNPTMHGGYDDWEFWLRLSSLGRRGKAIQDPLFLHRRHGSTMTTGADTKREAWISKLHELNPEFFGNRNLRLRLRNLQPIPTNGALGPLQSALQSTMSTSLPGLLVLVPWLPQGGSEMLLLTVLKKVASNFRIVIVTSIAGDNSMAREFAKLTKEIFNLPAMLDQNAWLEFVGMLIKSRSVATILASNSPFFYENGAALRASFPEVRFVDILHNDLPEGHIGRARYMSEIVDTEIVVSSKIASSLALLGFPPTKIATIPNGIDMEKFSPGAATRSDAREKFGLPHAAFVVAYVGRLSAEKRPESFLDILAETRLLDPTVHGFLVGDGPLRESLLPKMKVLGSSLTWLQHVDASDMPSVYAATDVVMLTSEIEGMPFVVLEAMASGVPVLATNVGALASLVTDGVSGDLVDPAKPEALVPRLVRLGADRNRLIAYGQAAQSTIAGAGLDRGTMLDAYARLLMPKG